MAFLSNNIFTAIKGELMSNGALSGLTITKEEYPSGVHPALEGDIHIGLKGGQIQRLFGSELQQYTLKVGVSTRGNSSFDTALQVHSQIRDTLEPAEFAVSGGDLIFCLAVELPTQEDSKPIDYTFALYTLEIQVAT